MLRGPSCQKSNCASVAKIAAIFPSIDPKYEVCISIAERRQSVCYGFRVIRNVMTSTRFSHNKPYTFRNSCVEHRKLYYDVMKPTQQLKCLYSSCWLLPHGMLTLVTQRSSRKKLSEIDDYDIIAWMNGFTNARSLAPRYSVDRFSSSWASERRSKNWGYFLNPNTAFLQNILLKPRN